MQLDEAHNVRERSTNTAKAAFVLLLEQRILTPIQKNGMVGPGKYAFKKLKILLDRMMLRRTEVRVFPLTSSADNIFTYLARFNERTTSGYHRRP
jgi:hypothetical protein